ncbi:GatB/YqeY domain-containing protein [bacterium]|nr:GatB/YqeY domain-containing protein [bacterium]
MAKSEIASRIQSEVVVAMKAKNKERLGVLRMLQSALKQVEVDTRTELDDEAVIKVLASYGKKVKDQIRSYGDGGRDDLKAAAEAEMGIVEEFLPGQMSDAEIAAAVQEAIAETGAAGPQDMGKVMKALMPKTAGRADGGKVSALVKKALVG